MCRKSAGGEVRGAQSALAGTEKRRIKARQRYCCQWGQQAVRGALLQVTAVRKEHSSEGEGASRFALRTAASRVCLLLRI